MSSRCKSELLKWRLKAESRKYVFASPLDSDAPLSTIRRHWPNTLKAAGLEYFWLYDLRSTFASRMTEAGVSPVFVAQIMGHSNTDILQTYARAIDEYRRSAISKLEVLREAHPVQSDTAKAPTTEETQEAVPPVLM